MPNHLWDSRKVTHWYAWRKTCLSEQFCGAPAGFGVCWNQPDQQQLCAWFFSMRRGTGLAALKSSSWISLIILRKFAAQKYICQLIRLRLEVQGDMLMLSTTKSASFSLPPGIERKATEENCFWSVAVSRNSLWVLYWLTKSLQLLSLEELNGWSILAQLLEKAVIEATRHSGSPHTDIQLFCCCAHAASWFSSWKLSLMPRNRPGRRRSSVSL